MAIKLYVYICGDMDTKIIDFYSDLEGRNKCIESIKNNEVVVFPTETVYGIGANALSREGILKIFDVKNRAKDNPLIVHICDPLDISKYARDINPYVYKLIDKFWPGPLTVILHKKDIIPYETTGGRDTIALRMPNHNIALDLIRESGCPIAAPSANISGRPSGTNARRCFEDLYGRVRYIIDGDQSDIGLESTVIDCTSDYPVLLRPGNITIRDIKGIIPEAYIYDKINDKFAGDNPISPGLKYKHYAPKGDMVILKGELLSIECYIRDMSTKFKNIGILCVDEHYDFYNGISKSMDLSLEIVVLGSKHNYNEISRNLFESLRRFDDIKCDFIISECFYEDFSNAVMNRLLRAASHNIINL